MSSKATISEVLKAAIEQSDLTRYRISRECGIPITSLRRFLDEGLSIRLTAADRLAALLGLHLVPDADAVPPEPTPEKRARPMLAKRKTKPTRRPGNKRKAKG